MRDVISLSRRLFLIGMAICSLGAVLSSCGYHMQNEGLAARFNSISVPYVEGDTDGSLTAAVIKEIVQSGTFEYRHTGGRLILYIKKVDLREENIGFRYDRKKRGQLTKEIIPTETRMTVFVEVSVVDAASCATMLGPVRLAAGVDFDHDYYFSRDSVNVFSLGQLSDIDAAYDAVEIPLQRTLAKKIVDYVNQSW